MYLTIFHIFPRNDGVVLVLRSSGPRGSVQGQSERMRGGQYTPDTRQIIKKNKMSEVVKKIRLMQWERLNDMPSLALLLYWSEIRIRLKNHGLWLFELVFRNLAPWMALNLFFDDYSFRGSTVLENRFEILSIKVCKHAMPRKISKNLIF